MWAFQKPLLLNAPNSTSKFRRTALSNKRRQATCTRFARRLATHCTSYIPKQASTESDTESYPLLANATIVNVQLPLDVYLEETKDGQVFIDELIPDGFGARSGLLHEGDVIVAVSLPFGDELSPVPNTDALDMIEDFIETRAEETFKLAVTRTESVEQLRAKACDDEIDPIAVSKLRNLVHEIFAPEYPMEPPDDENLSRTDPKFQPDLESLREYGFNLDDIDFNSHLQDT